MDNSIQHHVIYVHGFNSSPGSFKALQLKAFVEQNKLDLQYHAPMLSHWPEQAMETLEDLLEGAFFLSIIIVTRLVLGST